LSGQEIRVKVSQYKIARPGTVLKIFGLGSCVALVLYDPEAGIGGLAHVLLPGPAPLTREGENNSASSYKYADRAVEALLGEMEKQGAEIKKLRAAVIGGANMFLTPDIEEKDMPGRPGIGSRNVEAVKKELERFEVPIFGEDTGGSNGRTITFDPGSGEVLITNYKGDRKVLAPHENGTGRMAVE